MKKFKPFVIPVSLLVLIDQTVKMVISKAFMKCELEIHNFTGVYRTS